MQAKVIGVFGKRGRGKSYTLKRIIGAYSRSIVVDPKNEHAALGVSPSSRRAFLRHWDKVADRAQWCIVLAPKSLRGSTDILAAADVLLPRIREVGKYAKDCLVAIDEVDVLADAFNREELVTALVDYLRSEGVSVAFAARRPACVPTTLVSQCDELVIFRQHQSHDIKYFRPIIGDANADRLPHLGEHEALIWHDDERVRLGEWCAV